MKSKKLLKYFRRNCGQQKTQNERNHVFIFFQKKKNQQQHKRNYVFVMCILVGIKLVVQVRFKQKNKKKYDAELSGDMKNFHQQKNYDCEVKNLNNLFLGKVYIIKNQKKISII